VEKHELSKIDFELIDDAFKAALGLQGSVRLLK
jgi:hypothetical protein